MRFCAFEGPVGGDLNKSVILEIYFANLIDHLNLGLASTEHLPTIVPVGCLEAIQ